MFTNRNTVLNIQIKIKKAIQLDGRSLLFMYYKICNKLLVVKFVSQMNLGNQSIVIYNQWTTYPCFFL